MGLRRRSRRSGKLPVKAEVTGYLGNWDSGVKGSFSKVCESYTTICIGLAFARLFGSGHFVILLKKSG